MTIKKWTFLFLLLQWMLMSVAHASLFYGGMGAWLAGNYYSSQGNYFTLEGNNNSWPSTALRLVIGTDKKTLIGSTIVKSYIPTPCAYERLVMVRVQRDEEVSVYSMQSATRYFQCVTVTNGAVAKIQSNYTIALSLWEDPTVYLGFLVEYANGAKSVGVISLDVSTDWIDVLNSVIDTDYAAEWSGRCKGVECLENCRVENCGYGFSNAYARACTFTNVRAPLAPGAGTRAKIAVTADGPRVTPMSSNLEGRTPPMLFGTPALAESNWSMTTNFSDAAFLRSNRFFTIGVVR